MSHYPKVARKPFARVRLWPRHFGAISGLAAILLELERKQEALDAFERVLKIYPAHQKAQAAVIELIEDLDGEPL